MWLGASYWPGVGHKRSHHDDAMVDRDDDLRIGVKSTAILFGQYDTRIIGFLQLITLALLWTVGELEALGWPYQLSLVFCGALFSYQQILISLCDKNACFHSFLNNHLFGLRFFLLLYF